MRPVVAERLAVVAPRGRLELFEDVASIVPIRFIARLLGLPGDDDATLRQAKAWLGAVLAWRHTYGADAEVREVALEATRHITPMLLDVIRQRRDELAQDMISWLWLAGRDVAADWAEDDVLANATFLFEAGAETTSLLICTLVKQLLDEPRERRFGVLADAQALRRYNRRGATAHHRGPLACAASYWRRGARGQDHPRRRHGPPGQCRREP